jgi:hypothetical protein
MPCGLLTGVPERVPIVGRIQPMRFVMAGVETPPRSIELSSQTSDPMTKSAPLKANLTPGNAHVGPVIGNGSPLLK